MTLDEISKIIRDCEAEKTRAKELILKAKEEAKAIIKNANDKQNEAWKKYKREHNIR